MPSVIASPSPLFPATGRLAAALLAALGALALFPVAVSAQSVTVESKTGPVRVETVARGLEHPWGLALLADGRMLVTERPGRLRLVAGDGKLSPPIAGVPAVFASGQGGLLDVVLSPSFAEDRLVYLSYAEPGEGGAGTAVARGRLSDDARELSGLQVIFRQQPKVSGGRHFGARIVFDRDGNLFLTLGDRGKDKMAQELSNHVGTVVRIRPDGSVPPGNPFVGRQGALPEIWSYGHRNGQGAALHPATGKLWMTEHGPRGGDEINVPEAGRNYGWPLVSWGSEYSGWPIPDPPTRPQLAGAAFQWTPVIAASGLAFYTGDLFPAWRGNLLAGGLVAQAVVRLAVDGEAVNEIERISIDSRVRDVRVGADGAVYVLTDEDDGKILRLTPARR